MNSMIRRYKKKSNALQEALEKERENVWRRDQVIEELKRQICVLEDEILELWEKG